MKKFCFLLFFLTLTSAHALDFKVLSWNVYMLPKPIKKSLQNTRARVIPEQLKNSDYDLIFMQEAFINKVRNNTRAALKKTHPYSYYLKSPWFPYPIFGSGLFVISRYPVKFMDHVYFRSCRGADCLAAKGAVMMEIKLPDGKLVHMVNTHLQAMNGMGHIRMKQLRQIHSMLARNGQPDIPQFLIGDLNIDQKDPEFLLGLSLLGMKYTQLTGPIRHTGGFKNPCFKTGDHHEWIDHMWYENYQGVSSSEMRVKVFEFEYQNKICPSSDHHAIEATFDL